MNNSTETVAYLDKASRNRKYQAAVANTSFQDRYNKNAEASGRKPLDRDKINKIKKELFDKEPMTIEEFYEEMYS